MRFHKHVPQENREVLREQLKKYEAEMAMTSLERKELHKWVASGRSPYDNGDYIYSENGWPMDFVNAMRFVEEEIEWFQNLSEEEREEFLRENQPQYDTVTEEPILQDSYYTKYWDPEEELPFQ